MFSSTSQMLIILLWFLCASTMNSLMGPGKLNHVHCNEKDHYMLSIFRQGIEDPLSRLSSWSIEEDCCKWAGVQCDNITGRVIELDLHCSLVGNCRLSGEINSSLFELEFLSYLDLSGNEFEAIHFPPVHGHANDQRSHNSSLKKTSSSPTKFSNLFYLDISENSIHMDNLSWVSCFPSMKYLNLSGVTINHETFWFQHMIMLPSLVELRLSRSSLTGFGNDPSLQYINFTSLSFAVLDISDNFIDSEIPKWLFNLSSSMSFVNLHGNLLRGQIPATMINSQHLKTLDLGSNNLNGTIPEWMGQYKHLEYLDLSDNLFSGPIPATFGNLSSLRFLYAGHNQLNGTLPSNFGRLSTLEELSIGYNSFSGNLSEQSFANLSKLKVLHIEASAFIFHFGTNWQPPFQLEELRMRNCKVDPELPSWLSTQRSLSSLDISSSGLSFTAHEEFWRFVAQIDFVDLYNNSISGDISVSLILNNSMINLQTNNLTGNLPRLSPKVSFFSIADNRLSGSISPSLCYSMIGKTKLEFLDLSNNLLSGELPDCWMQWKSLRRLNLGNNILTGKIPASMGSLTELRTLRLHNNSLFGNIPASLKSFKELWFLELAFNEFTGNVPTWISQFIVALLLRSNKFNGSIPSYTCQLSNLAVLDLADNRLSGPIPKCLSNITMMATDNAEADFLFLNLEWELPPARELDFVENIKLFVKGRDSNYKETFVLLRFVDLSSNGLSGLLPSELFSLFALQSLNLSHNHLKGVIPNEIGHMRFLESLDLSGNLFSGEIPESMSNLSFLNHLNLSYNNFKGRIPPGTQLQSFDEFSFIGNPELCGARLPKNCTQQGDNNNGSKWMEDKDNDFRSWFNIGMGVGFAFGFWAACGSLFIVRRWRHAYFQILDKLYVFVAVKMNRMF